MPTGSRNWLINLFTGLTAAKPKLEPKAFQQHFGGTSVLSWPKCVSGLAECFAKEARRGRWPSRCPWTIFACEIGVVKTFCKMPDDRQANRTTNRRNPSWHYKLISYFLHRGRRFHQELFNFDRK